MTIALAHSRGLLAYDERVATYWPEFAQNGKDQITVRQLLAHEAGLPVVDEPLDAGKARRFRRPRSDDRAPAAGWEPGTKHGYHGVSLGWYEGELIRRVDPKRRTLGRFFAEEIARPLGLEFYFDCRHGVGAERVASIQASRSLRALLQLRHLPRGMLLAFTRPTSLTARAFTNPRFRSPAAVDSPRYRAVEFPAAGGIGQVRGIARAYAAFAVGGSGLGGDPRDDAGAESPSEPAERRLARRDPQGRYGLLARLRQALPGL